MQPEMDGPPAAAAAPTAVPPKAPRGVGAVQERLALGDLDYPIAPSANRLPYMLGGLTFVGILVLIITGVLLDQFYNPSPTAAHDSIVYIITRVPLGNWVRGLHYWAATIVLVSVVLHIGYVFWRRSYLRPREVTWWAGVGLFVLLFGLGFTGTVLRGDQDGTEALEHFVAGARLVGALGAPFSPDFARSTSLLGRLHSMHVSLLPLLLLGLIGLHFWLIRALGIHTHEPKTSRFTRHLPRLAGYGLLLVAAIGVLAAAFPPGIGHPGVSGVEVTKPFWPFLWIYAVENTVGMTGMVFAPLVLFGFLFLVPLLDRGGHPAGEGHGHESGRARPRWLLGLAVLLLLLYVGGIVYGVFAPQMEHLGM